MYQETFVKTCSLLSPLRLLWSEASKLSIYRWRHQHSCGSQRCWWWWWLFLATALSWYVSCFMKFFVFYLVNVWFYSKQVTLANEGGHTSPMHVCACVRVCEYALVRQTSWSPPLKWKVNFIEYNLSEILWIFEIALNPSAVLTGRLRRTRANLINTSFEGRDSKGVTGVMDVNTFSLTAASAWCRVNGLGSIDQKSLKTEL